MSGTPLDEPIKKVLPLPDLSVVDECLEQRPEQLRDVRISIVTSRKGSAAGSRSGEVDRRW
jgi:hypothetical protein